jgi:hypothetical protein
MENRISKISTVILSWAALSPVAFAQVQNVPDPTAVTGIVGALKTWTDTLVPIVMVIAVLVFFWGIVQYMTAGADEEKRGAARNLMIYGVIGLFVMVSIWGLVKFLGTTFGVTQGGEVGKVKLPSSISQ